MSTTLEPWVRTARRVVVAVAQEVLVEVRPAAERALRREAGPLLAGALQTLGRVAARLQEPPPARPYEALPPETQAIIDAHRRRG